MEKIKMDIKSCLDIPKVMSCSATECSYNKANECHAVAITVGGHKNPLCDTFYNSGRKGGVAGINGGVGACRKEDCRFNTDLECMASRGISVAMSEGQANCSTFSPE